MALNRCIYKRMIVNINFFLNFIFFQFQNIYAYVPEDGELCDRAVRTLGSQPRSRVRAPLAPQVTSVQPLASCDKS